MATVSGTGFNFYLATRPEYVAKIVEKVLIHVPRRTFRKLCLELEQIIGLKVVYTWDKLAISRMKTRIIDIMTWSEVQSSFILLST